MRDTKYTVRDLQGGCFGESLNEGGGATIQELRRAASSWLYSDDEEDFKAPIRDRWSVEQIADFWELEILPVSEGEIKCF